MKSVIVHYQEIALKGNNRPWFISRLVRHLRAAMGGLDALCNNVGASHCDGDRRHQWPTIPPLLARRRTMDAAARRPLKSPPPTFAELFTPKLVTLLRAGYTRAELRALCDVLLRHPRGLLHPLREAPVHQGE